MKLIEKTVSQEMIYQGKIINLRRDKAELENGRIAHSGKSSELIQSDVIRETYLGG